MNHFGRNLCLGFECAALLNGGGEKKKNELPEFDGDRWQLTRREVMCLVALRDRWSRNASCVGGGQWRRRTLGHAETKS